MLFDRYCAMLSIRKIPRRQIHSVNCLLTHLPPLKSALYVYHGFPRGDKKCIKKDIFWHFR